MMPQSFDFRARYGDELGTQLEGIVSSLDPSVASNMLVIEGIVNAFFVGRTGSANRFDLHLIQSEPVRFRDRQVIPLEDL